MSPKSLQAAREVGRRLKGRGTPARVTSILLLSASLPHHHATHSECSGMPVASTCFLSLGSTMSNPLLSLRATSSKGGQALLSRHPLIQKSLWRSSTGSVGGVREGLGLRMTSSSGVGVSKAYDQEQMRLLDSDECILVNDRDEVVGSASKKFCHMMENINSEKALHRAFSIFLFNSKNELLLQKRSSDKILFPGRWTNTCCSHPLSIPDELDNPASLEAAGVKRATVRKLEQELGIPLGQVSEESLHFMTRIVYRAAVGEDDVWGEHEVDYILIARADVDTNMNPNEVSEIQYLTKSGLQDLLLAEDKGELMLSPWFRLIAKQWLPVWWDALVEGKLESVQDRSSIHLLS